MTGPSHFLPLNCANPEQLVILLRSLHILKDVLSLTKDILLYLNHDNDDILFYEKLGSGHSTKSFLI